MTPEEKKFLNDWLKNNGSPYTIDELELIRKRAVHTHKIDNTFPTQPYAIPGTVRDSQRNVKESFNIEGHGCFILLDNKLQVII